MRNVARFMTIARTTKEYFEEWHPYDRLIKYNYMRHREMIELLRQYSTTRSLEGNHLLELGCGNAHTIAEAFSNVGQLHYSGMDLSNTALTSAAARLKPLDWDLRLIPGDLRESLDSFKASVDLVVAGFSLHHFSSADNLHILKAVKRCLSKGGECIIYDIVTREREPRDDYIARLVSGIRNLDMGLNPEQTESIAHHVEHYDYPISLAHWEQLATEAGFERLTCKYRDGNDYYAYFIIS